MKCLQAALFPMSLVSLLFAGVVPGRAVAEAPRVALETQPASLAVPPQGVAEALVVFRNASDEKLERLRLSWLPPTGLKVAAVPETFPSVGPYQEVAGVLRVSRDPQGPLPAELSLRMDYDWLRESKAVPRVAVAALKVSFQEPGKVEQVASVEVKSVVKSLVEGRPGSLYLVVTNTSNEPIRVGTIVVEKPPFLSVTSVTPRNLRGPQDLGPRDTRTILWEAAVKSGGKERIHPGKHLILFEVPLAWNSGGRKFSGTLVASHETEVGVLGESEILTALGVPTFLVLPGFLMVVAFSLLWKAVPSLTGTARRQLPLESKSLEFWLVAVTLSILAAAAYPELTERLGGDRRSYLEGYDLSDVLRVWTGSILAATLAFVLHEGLAIWREARRRQSTFAQGDLPLATLRKLERHGDKVFLPRVRVKIGNEVRQAFLLQRDGDQIWIAPGIRLVGVDKEDAKWQAKIRELLVPQGDPGTLADLLEGTQGRVRADWNPDYGLDGVRAVPVADAQGAPELENSFVQIGSEGIE